MPPIPRTSIGISIFQQPDYWVRDCIASARHQSDASIEILIRPDGPDAVSSELLCWLQQLAIFDKRVILLPGASNLGTFGSYRDIFSQAQGQFFAQLDADDLLHREAIARCRAELEQHPELSFLYTDCLEIDSENQPIKAGLRQHVAYSATTSLVQFIPFHLRLVRRDVYEQIGGYDAGLLYSGDYDLTLRLSEVGAVGYLPVPLYLYRVHDTNTSKIKRQATAEEALLVARAALRRRGLYPRFSLELDSNQQVLLKQQEP